MYAIVKTGGKQYTVKPGDVFDVEKLPGEVGDTVTLPALFLNDNGSIVTDAQELANVVVEAQILKQHKGEKKIVFKFKKRKGYKRTKGHRQNLTLIAITNVNGEKAEVPERPGKKQDQVELKVPDPELAEEAAEQEVPAEAPEQEAAENDAAEQEAVEQAKPEELSKMTVAQLKEIAKDRDIKLPSGARKADIIEAIQNA